MIIEQLFNLVKSALWQMPADASLFSPQPDWQALYTLAPAEACWHPLKLIKTFVSIRLNRWFS